MRERTVINISVFLTGFSGIVAEYALATLATYLLGNAVLQWSVTISIFLLFMGLGARASKLVPHRALTGAFVLAEVFLSFLVALSPLIAYSFAHDPGLLKPVLYSLCALIGALIGTEIPLAMRINSAYARLEENVSSVLEKDYLGALPAGLLYAYVLLPKLGLVHTTLLAGLLNLTSALLFSVFLSRSPALRALVLTSLLLLSLFGAFAEKLALKQEQKLYGEKIIYFERTPYQKIVLTRYKDVYNLYLDGHLQFSTLDEKRYHELIAHAPASLLKEHRRALILGGGDGLALRELLSYPFSEIVLVELDPGMLRFSREHPVMRRINNDSLRDERVRALVGDAFEFVFKDGGTYDLIVVDLVDPRTPSSARVYSLEFYRRARQLLSENGILITQAGDAFYRREVFCSIKKTLSSAGFFVLPLVLNIPTLGEWGFLLASKQKLSLSDAKLKDTSFLTKDILVGALGMGKRVRCEDEEVNTLLKPVLVHYYYKEFP
ncbi:MAG: polyamine aminopropyltransferase [Aquificae bacterium]|nr:polyamine aminopropyltransferase [Aquificota bacterium]